MYLDLGIFLIMSKNFSKRIDDKESLFDSKGVFLVDSLIEASDDTDCVSDDVPPECFDVDLLTLDRLPNKEFYEIVLMRFLFEIISLSNPLSEHSVIWAFLLFFL